MQKLCWDNTLENGFFLPRILLTPFLDMYPGSVECRSARKGNSDWSAGELPIRVIADEETAECG